MSLSIQVNLLPEGIWVAEIWHAHEQLAEISREGESFVIGVSRNPATFPFDEFVQTLNKARTYLAEELERKV